MQMKTDTICPYMGLNHALVKTIHHKPIANSVVYSLVGQYMSTQIEPEETCCKLYTHISLTAAVAKVQPA